MCCRVVQLHISVGKIAGALEISRYVCELIHRVAGPSEIVVHKEKCFFRAVINVWNFEWPAHVSAESFIPARNFGRVGLLERIRPRIQCRVSDSVVEAVMNTVDSLPLYALRSP